MNRRQALLALVASGITLRPVPADAAKRKRCVTTTPARPAPRDHRVLWSVHGAVTDNASPTPAADGSLFAVDVGQVLDPDRGEGAEVFHTQVRREGTALKGRLTGHVFFLDGAFVARADLDLVGLGAGAASIAFRGPVTITGGTGAYRGARGVLHLDGEQNSVTYGFSATIVGTVRY